MLMFNLYETEPYIVQLTNFINYFEDAFLTLVQQPTHPKTLLEENSAVCCFLPSPNPNSTNQSPASAAPPRTTVRPDRPACPAPSARRATAATSVCPVRRAARAPSAHAVQRACRAVRAWTAVTVCPANRAWTACRAEPVRTAFRARTASTVCRARTARTGRMGATARRARPACRDRRDLPAREVTGARWAGFEVAKIAKHVKSSKGRILFDYRSASKLLIKITFVADYTSSRNTRTHTQCKPFDLC